MSEFSSQYDRVVVKLDEFGKGTVSVNGHLLKSSMGVSLEAVGGEITIVTIKLLASADFDVLAKDVDARLVRSLSDQSVQEVVLAN